MPKKQSFLLQLWQDQRGLWAALIFIAKGCRAQLIRSRAGPHCRKECDRIVGCV